MEIPDQNLCHVQSHGLLQVYNAYCNLSCTEMSVIEEGEKETEQEGQQKRQKKQKQGE